MPEHCLYMFRRSGVLDVPPSCAVGLSINSTLMYFVIEYLDYFRLCVALLKMAPKLASLVSQQGLREDHVLWLGPMACVCVCVCS